MKLYCLKEMVRLTNYNVKVHGQTMVHTVY